MDRFIFLTKISTDRSSKTIFDNNPHIDGYVDKIDGEVFHDHYKINNNTNTPVPLIEQILKFWQFEEKEYKDSQPELYFSDDEINLGNKIIKEYKPRKEEGVRKVLNIRPLNKGLQEGNWLIFINDNP